MVADLLRLRRCCGDVADTVSEHENVVVTVSEHENVAVAELLRSCCGYSK